MNPRWRLIFALAVFVAWIDLGHLNPLIALAIASLKSTLVVLFFMHMRHSDRLVWLSFITALVFVGLLLGGSLDDELTRTTPTFLPEPLPGTGEPVMGLDGASATR